MRTRRPVLLGAAEEDSVPWTLARKRPLAKTHRNFKSPISTFKRRFRERRTAEEQRGPRRRRRWRFLDCLYGRQSGSHADASPT